MRKFFFYTALVAMSTRGFAADLSEFGIADAVTLSDQEAAEVRGLGGYATHGLEAAVTSVSTNSLAFSIVDQQSGSVFNLNATSQTRGKDTVSGQPTSLDGGMQSLGLVNTGGVQFGDATFEMGEFGFGMSGVAAFGQSSQIAGPSHSLDFSALLQ